MKFEGGNLAESSPFLQQPEKKEQGGELMQDSYEEVAGEKILMTALRKYRKMQLEGVELTDAQQKHFVELKNKEIAEKTGFEPLSETDLARYNSLSSNQNRKGDEIDEFRLLQERFDATQGK